MTMPVVIDVSASVNSKAGLGRYAESLVQHLGHTWVGSEVYLFYNRRPGGQLPPSLKGFPARRVTLGYKPWRLLLWMAHRTSVHLDVLLPRGTRLFHATEHLLLPLRHVPTVLTVHDLIFERYPRYHKRLNYLFLTRAMPLFVRKATAIIAVSHATRRDLERFYRVPGEKIRVIYEAPAPHFRPPPAEAVRRVREKYGLPERYLLTVGTLEPRKNLIRLLEVFERVHGEGGVDGLVIVGARGWLYDAFFRRLDASPVRDRVVLPGYVPDADLPALYAGSTLFVLPSLYEGFGLPLLEAMASGAAVVASRTGALPEVGGNAARYFDPENPEEMAHVIARCLRDEDLRDAMRVAGREQVARFSWERTAQETAQLYQEVMEQSGR